MARDTDERLMRPYRTVRRVSADGDAPWPGVLVRLESGESRVLVDAAVLPPQWAGWRGASDGHLLAPIDVVRRLDAHDVVLPMCTHRVSDFFERRRAGRVPLSAGEAVTLAVSIVRGLAELGDDRAAAVGEWWLTDAGRPVLATDLGAMGVRDASLALLDEVAFDQKDPRLWRDVRAAVERDEGARGLVHLEQRLFAWTVPAPLAETPLAPRRPTLLEPVTVDHARRDDVVSVLDDGPRRGLVDRLVRHIDADLADLVSKSTTGIWRRLRARPAAGRGRPWMLAGAVAVAVLTVGVFWPTGSADPVAADAPQASPTPVHAADETVHADPVAPASADLATLTAELLTARTACAAEPECLARHVVDPAIDVEAGERTVTLVDEFGGVAVLRVAPVRAEGETQLVVIQRNEDGLWLLRDVYVAQQP